MNIVCDWLSCHPRRTLIIVFTVLAPLLSYFLLFELEIRSDVRRGFAQKGGRSIEEFKRFADFYNVTSDGLEIWVLLITPKRGSGHEYLNMSMELLNEVERLDELVRNTTATYKGQIVHFSDLHKVDINYIFHWYKHAYFWSHIISDVNLSFPIGRAMGHKFFIGSHFFGVNKHKESERGPIEQMEYVTLWYMGQAENYTQRMRLQALQIQFFDLARADNFSNLFSFEMYGDQLEKDSTIAVGVEMGGDHRPLRIAHYGDIDYQIANAEVLRGSAQTAGLFGLGVFLMTVFMAVAFHHISLICQPILILGALASPAIATATTFAILGWFNFPFNSIMCITPFLVMGIGVDDAFLLLHSWRNHGHLEKKERMRMVVHAVGPSMAITSATNTLAFGIGIVSPSPQMSAFCLCTCIAIFLDFIFEFLIFGSMIAIFYKEREVKHELLDNLVSWESYTKVLLSPLGRAIVIATTLVIYCLAFIGINGMKTVFDPTKTFPTDSVLTPSFGKFEKIQREYYPINFISLVPALEDEAGKKKFFEMIGRLEHGDGCYGPERTQLMLRYFIEWGEAQNITNLTYDDLPRFLSNRNIGDETVIHYKNNNGTIDEVWMNYIIICRGKCKVLTVTSLVHAPCNGHSVAPAIWNNLWCIMSYGRHLKLHNEWRRCWSRHEPKDYWRLVQAPCGKIARSLAKYATDAQHAIRLFTAERTICGELDWNKRAMQIDRIRGLIDEYPQFQTSLFDYDSTIYDIIITVKGEMAKSVAITFACMTATCAIMIPCLAGASVATLSMLSISYSLLGFLALWGQNLDPVAMINVLMAVGFSVDFSAHVCYHYYVSLKKSTLLSFPERMTKILQTVGKPIVEASLSTFICMLPLFYVRTYIIVAFAKTVTLVATFGLLHGIVIIPVCLSFFPVRTKSPAARTSGHLEEQKESMLA